MENTACSIITVVR